MCSVTVVPVIELGDGGREPVLIRKTTNSVLDMFSLRNF